ncbi:MAG: periplasmic heavy metal sensor [Acidobacteriota bacterium]|nr:periplasmic heavy metal sensor [Acidobacteriota bacterium]
MKVWNVARWAVMSVALGTLGVAAAQAQGGPPPDFGGHRPPMQRMMGSHGNHWRWWNSPNMIAKLKLTDEQRKAMDGILLDHREKLIDLHANLEKAELAMDPMMSADQPNESAILAQIDKVAMARAELEKANARFLLAIRAKLTPEQWKILQADRKDRMNRRDHRWDRRDGRRNGPPPPPDGGKPDSAPGAPGSGSGGS